VNPQLRLVLLALALLASLLGSSASTAPAAVVAQETSTPSSAPVEAFSGERAKQTVEVLATEIGPRPAGSEALARATDYLRSAFEALGYETRGQEFPITAYVDGGASLRLVGAHTDVFTPAAVAYSASGEVEAEVVDAGLGRPEELAAAAGKLALIRRGELRFAQKVANAAAAGAVGVILYNDGPGTIAASLFAPGAIPAVMLSGEEGEALRAALVTTPLTAHLAVQGTVEQRTGRNVVAHRAGASGRTVVVGAHYDSVPNGPGANDNGSGTAVLLETARVMAGRPYPHTLELVAFDGEELGLLVSRFYVEQLSPAERQALVGMIDLDMLSVGETLQFAGSEALVAQALHLADLHGWPASRLGGALAGGSDHASFLRVGIEAVFIYRSDDPRYHSPLDTAEHVLPENLTTAGTLALGLLDFLAGR